MLELDRVHEKVSKCSREKECNWIGEDHPSLAVMLHILLVNLEEAWFPEKKRISQSFQEDAGGYIVNVLVIPEWINKYSGKQHQKTLETRLVWVVAYWEILS